MTRNFFSLEGNCTDLDEVGFMALAYNEEAQCENRLYRPDTLKSPYQSGHLRVKDVVFRNVSFSRTKITRIEFTNCTFERCLFMSVIFLNCRFNSCVFTDCNPNKIEFEACYIDPKSFENCVLDNKYYNIGVYLFQELFRNSREQHQPDFADDAQYLFRKWQREQLRQEIRSLDPLLKSHKRWRLARLNAYEFMSGSGVRLGKLATFGVMTLLLFTMTNWMLANQFGLKPCPTGLIEAFYFSTIVVTTLGFGDITPTTTFGRLMVSGEAISGFVLFALVTSTLYRKFSS